jgi:hypothetical protein
MPRTSGRRRRRRKTTGAAGNGLAASLLSQVSQLVNENEALSRENRELHSVLSGIADSAQSLRTRSVSSAGGRRPRGRPAGQVSANGRRRRRRITDPATLAKRRAGLAKARRVLAAKRAAAKKAAT